MLGTCEIAFGVLCPDLSSLHLECKENTNVLESVQRSDARLVRDWSTGSLREIEGTGFVHPGKGAAEGW